MEGFYGDSSPNKIKANPGSFKFGTDFVTNNLNKAIDFATIHVYPDAWLVSSSSLITYFVFYQRDLNFRPVLNAYFDKN